MKLNHLHPTNELLEQYAMRRIGSGEEEFVEEHLLICELCQLRLERLEAEIYLMRIVLSERAGSKGCSNELECVGTHA